jgi:hypothetical protein
LLYVFIISKAQIKLENEHFNCIHSINYMETNWGAEAIGIFGDGSRLVSSLTVGMFELTDSVGSLTNKGLK